MDNEAKGKAKRNGDVSFFVFLFAAIFHVNRSLPLNYIDKLFNLFFYQQNGTLWKKRNKPANN